MTGATSREDMLPNGAFSLVTDCFLYTLTQRVLAVPNTLLYDTLHTQLSTDKGRGDDKRWDRNARWGPNPGKRQLPWALELTCK